ncbi:mechanosensitive ion channel [Labilibaculum sp. A4]|uniref:mechanosensitive ion channel family protein n=1 Tax=Labilibaculum euxinus TaxID=2686357 RepID=UPI000F626C06|nr:mechanosensitive ion channel domain-containing protein [Labilibaculum euxinus]MDQ1770553.1 mechanosensitive ion channel [Labilibaculum euxinus]MWN75228.1 mechanosensitive ion channel [Labilibaculum euxinus]
MIELQEISNKTIELLPKIGLGGIILFLFIMFSWLIKKIVTKRIKPKTKNPLLADFLGKVVAFMISITGFVFFLHIIGLGGIAKNIMAGAGITTFIIGFAFKDIGENFLSGILMAFKSPFKVGDLIETGGTIGYVSELNLRESILKTLDGKDVFIPNSQIIKSPLFNYTIDGYLRYEITIKLDYKVDFKKVSDIINSILAEIPEVLSGDKKPMIVIDELAANTVNLKILYWINTFKSKSKAYHLQIKSQILIKTIEDLTKNGLY